MSVCIPKPNSTHLPRREKCAVSYSWALTPTLQCAKSPLLLLRCPLAQLHSTARGPTASEPAAWRPGP